MSSLNRLASHLAEVILSAQTADGEEESTLKVMPNVKRSAEMVKAMTADADKRSSYLGPPQCFLLDHACSFVARALGDTCYLVGSATRGREFRDVDVRMIMSVKKWEALFGRHSNGEVKPFWSLLCTSISLYLSQQTGLKVDFQIQRRDTVSEKDWKMARIPLGIYPIDQEPEWYKIDNI